MQKSTFCPRKEEMTNCSYRKTIENHWKTWCFRKPCPGTNLAVNWKSCGYWKTFKPRWLEWHFRTWRHIRNLAVKGVLPWHLLGISWTPWKPLGFLAFPMPSPDAEQCAPKAPWRPVRKYYGYRKIVKNHWLQWHFTFPSCQEQDQRFGEDVSVGSFVIWAPHNAYGNPSKTIGNPCVSEGAPLEFHWRHQYSEWRSDQ